MSTERLIPLTKGQFAVVDADDYDWLMRWKWHAKWNQNSQSYYAQRSDYRSGDYKAKRQRMQTMHRQILSLERGDRREGDHINRNSLDNRRSNLRIATRAQNQSNTAAYRNNKSGFKGVSLLGPSRRWTARIRVNKKIIPLGQHDTPELAHAAYCEAAKKYHGEFARFSREAR